MKAHLIFLILFVIRSAYAETGVLFPSNQAILIIQGLDSDAKTLFEAMNVTATKKSGTLKKEVNLTTSLGPLGDSVFKLTCKYTELSNAASCNIKVFSALEATINKNTKYILIGVNDRYAATQISKSFFDLDSNPHQRIIFHSINGKLKLWKTLNSNGDVVSFTMEYRE